MSRVIHVASLAKRTRILSIIYGIIWLIDAILKWTPTFLNNFPSNLQKHAETAPQFLKPWQNFWYISSQHDPVLWAVLVAIVESLLAISLLFGIARKPMYIVGFILSFGIWATAEGSISRLFSAGATDIGTSIMYCVVWATLWYLECFSAPYSVWTLDKKIADTWPAWRKVGMWEVSDEEETSSVTDRPIQIS